MKEPLFMQLGPGQHLVPADPHTAELVDTRLKPGTTYKVTVVNDRTAGSLKLYWAGLNLLHENLPEIDEFRWPTSRSLHNMLMMALGYTSREYFLDARSDDGVGWREVVDSIAIDNMDEATFKGTQNVPPQSSSPAGDGTRGKSGKKTIRRRRRRQ